MNGTRENRALLVDPIKGINGNLLKQMRPTKRLKLTTLNSHLVCVLCNGYYVEATAIVECLHRFCRSCIVKYLQTNNFCPICDVQLHQAKPWSSLRPDKTLQDLVYKLVPGLYQDEMRRRRQFYSRAGGEVDVGEGEEGGFLPQGARFFSQDDSISLSLEYYSQEDSEEEKDVPNKKKPKHPSEKPKRYLQCPAAVTVRHLKKFVRIKYGIGVDCWVDIIYNDECLPESFSLIDVAYTFTWKRTSPMRFSYRIFSKPAVRAVKSQKIFKTSRLDDGEGKKTKHPPSLEQQKQSEYLGNFNLNPTNSGFVKSQSYTKNKSYAANYHNNNNHHSIKTASSEEKKPKRNEFFFKDSPESEDGSRDKGFQSSEESNASGLRIISEKEESLRGNSEDSQESLLLEERRRRKKSEAPVPSFGEEAVDSFTAKKLLKNKHKSEEKRKQEESHGEKRRKSAGHDDDDDDDDDRKKASVAKRRKTVADEFSLKRDNEGKLLGKFSVRTDDEESESMENLKNEALRKVFVTKEKPDTNGKRKEGEVRRKKRKKSKHHEGEPRKRRAELVASSPSILSFAKDPLKLKVKLTPGKPVVKPSTEEPSERAAGGEETEGEQEREAATPRDAEGKNAAANKERLLHLRAVRHKNIVNKSAPKEYISAPPSLTISKVDSSEQQPVKSTLIESRPSLEIMLVSPTDNAKVKVDVTPEPRKEPEPKKAGSPAKEGRHSGVVDSFGVLDLSEKSTRTKEPAPNASSPKEAPEPAERCRKSTHQSILQIAQTLVNRKLSPILPENQLREGGFDGAGDSSATAAAMRNLKTLSDTAVNILMAAQSKNFPEKRSFPSSAAPLAHKAAAAPSSTKAKDCENGSGLKIPVYPISRERPNPIPPVPNLHEIYPRGRGRSLPLPRVSTPMIKPGQNQTVRQIPNPFVVINRQGNQNQNQSQGRSQTQPKPPPAPLALPPPPPPPPPPQPKPAENGDEGVAKQKLNSIPPLQSIKAKPPPGKLEDGPESNGEKTAETEAKPVVPKTLNNNNNNNNNNNGKTVQNGSECAFLPLKNGGEEKKLPKLPCGTNSIRRIENMAKNIESVAAGLTARAVSNAMVDAK